MQFYKDIFGGELMFMTLGSTPMAQDTPADKHDLIMHSTLKKGSWVLIGSDMMRDKAVIGDNVGVSIECENETELRTIFEKLAQGGDVFMAPEDAFWGAVFAMVTDRYGVEWMLNAPKTPEAKQ